MKFKTNLPVPVLIQALALSLLTLNPINLIQVQEVQANLIIAGSANLDTFLPIKRLPQPGENLTLLPNTHPLIDIPGGKGCNQAIACQKLSLSSDSDSDSDSASSPSPSSCKCKFLARIGTDDGGKIIRRVLEEHNVDISNTLEECHLFPTGRGYVFLESDTGRVSAVVSGGSNMYGWDDFGSKTAEELDELFHVGRYGDDNSDVTDGADGADDGGASNKIQCLLLQREVPEFVNLILARYAKERGILVLQDVGGEEREMDRDGDYDRNNDNMCTLLCKIH